MERPEYEKKTACVFPAQAVFMLRTEFPAYHVHGPAQGPKQEQSQDEIAHGVGDVKGDAADPIGEAGGRAVEDAPGQGAQGAKQQAVKPADNRPKHRAPPAAKQHCQAPEGQPDIEIAEKPLPKAIEQALEKHPGIEDIQRLFAVGQGIEEQEQGHRLDIGQAREGKLGDTQQRRQEPEHRQLPDVQAGHWAHHTLRVSSKWSPSAMGVVSTPVVAISPLLLMAHHWLADSSAGIPSTAVM